ncbi:MAG: Tim44 domain-containing protein [Legionella sp.]|nr:Tim44 domain-containing protein [Legionella sp.]
MRNALVALMVTLLTFSFTADLAFAKRFGGGRSFGVQRQSNHYSTPYNKPAAGMKQANKRHWGSMLGGLLVGGLLASLFMHNGFASGLLTWLFLGVLVFLFIGVFRRLMGSSSVRSNQAAPATGQGGWDYRREAFTNTARSAQQTQAPLSSSYSSDFNADAFLREAKVKFIRLQEAYDRKNVSDIREFTTPDVFAEIKMQLDEQGMLDNKTEVLSLNAELLDISPDTNLASVRFTGTVSENGISETLNEVWHFRQYGPHSWIVCGVQQAH